VPHLVSRLVANVPAESWMSAFATFTRRTLATPRTQPNRLKKPPQRQCRSPRRLSGPRKPPPTARKTGGRCPNACNRPRLSGPINARTRPPSPAPRTECHGHTAQRRARWHWVDVAGLRQSQYSHIPESISFNRRLSARRSTFPA
jgi:hypothetical protein